MSALSKKVLIGLDLLFDYNSLLFSLLRTFLSSRKDIQISSFHRKFIELNAPLKAIENLRSIDAKLNLELDKKTKENWEEFFAQNLSTIKPQIGAFHTLNFLRNEGYQVMVSSFLDSKMTSNIKAIHKSWFDYDIFNYGDKISYSELVTEIRPILSPEKNIFIDANNDNLVKLSEVLPQEKATLIYIKNSDFKNKEIAANTQSKSDFHPLVNYFMSFEETDWKKLLNTDRSCTFDEPEFFLELEKIPKNLELQAWKNIIYLENPIEITSQVIRGFGRGGRQLGIPTANLDITKEIAEKIDPLMAGIYFGWTTFVNSPFEGQDCKLYPSVMSIGYNPYFDNQEKTIEVHLMKSFEKDFYSEVLSVEILGFIRCEADFKCFDHLIKAIHNDVQTARDLLGNSKAKSESSLSDSKSL